MITRSILFGISMLLSFSTLRAAEGKEEASPAGFRGEFLQQLEQVQGSIVDLEQAVPPEKFSWRPGEGVRSISEVYLHIAFANYLFMKQAGYDPPADSKFDIGGKKWEELTTDRAMIGELLKKSFDHVRATGMKISDADLDNKVTLFGQKTTLRNALMTELSHLHEHLGQSIAYARMNGIVPPWTAAEEAKAKEKSK